MGGIDVGWIDSLDPRDDLLSAVLWFAILERGCLVDERNMYS